MPRPFSCMKESSSVLSVCNSCVIQDESFGWYNIGARRELSCRGLFGVSRLLVKKACLESVDFLLRSLNRATSTLGRGLIMKQNPLNMFLFKPKSLQKLYYVSSLYLSKEDESVWCTNWGSMRTNWFDEPAFSSKTPGLHHFSCFTFLISQENLKFSGRVCLNIQIGHIIPSTLHGF